MNKTLFGALVVATLLSAGLYSKAGAKAKNLSAPSSGGKPETASKRADGAPTA